MKMRSVIEAGRKAAPLVNKGLAETGLLLDSFRQLAHDLASVRSAEARDVLAAQCASMADKIESALVDTYDKWKALDAAISSYRRKFADSKIRHVRDLPGQQVLFSDGRDAIARQDGKESP